MAIDMRKVILNTREVLNIINRRNKTRIWLAERMGVSPVQLSHWLKHRKNPSPKNREKFIKALHGKGITWERLFTIIYEKND
jgi:hypothetical protein